MTIPDEQLSAFLDAELPDHEMELVREALAEDDETLTNRLAELALVDQLVRDSYRGIDQLPLPESVTALLSDKPRAGAEVIPFPWWRRVQRGLQQPAAVAACLLLALGFIVALLLPTGQPSDWRRIAEVLETGRSGVELALGGGEEVKPQLTFENREGLYCRQFQVRYADQPTQQGIACRKEQNWQLLTSVYLSQEPGAGYQTASGNTALESALDEMMHGEPFDVIRESQLLDRHWQP